MKRFLFIAAVACACLAAARTHAGTLAQFHIAGLGDMLIELYDTDKPVTAGNFVRYVQSDAYRDMFAHRWVPQFVIQGGGFYVADRTTTNATVKAVTAFPAITNEYSVGRTFSNSYGSIAMARQGGATNSATSQWFINLANNAFLDTVDGGFTVFGQLRVGTNVLNRFNLTTAANGIFRWDAGGVLNELPAFTSTNLTTDDVVYVAVTLPAQPRLEVRVNANTTRELSWNSLSNLVNHLEFTTNPSAGWQILLSTNSPGGILHYTDTAAPGASRLYRVRIE